MHFSASAPADPPFYEPAFVAQVAFEACATTQDETVAQKYGLAVDLVRSWRRQFEQTAARLSGRGEAGAPSSAAGSRGLPRDPRIDVLEQMEVSVAVLEGDELRYVYANPAYQAFAPGADLPGRRMREVFPESVSDGVEAGVRKVLATGEAWDVNHYTTRTPGQGEQVWEGKIARMPMVDGTAPRVVIRICDVTEAARREQALRGQVALLRAISEHSDDVMFAKDIDGRMQFANPAALALIGKSMDEVEGKTDAEFLSDQEAARSVMDNDRRIMRSGVAAEVEESVPMPDGSPRVWLSQKRPLRDDSGHVIGLLGVSRDITDRKHGENSMRAAHDALQRVLNSIADGLAVLDRNWRYTYFSETGAKMLGVRSEDFIGKYFWDLFPHADDLLFGREYRRAMETGVPSHFEEYYPEPLNMWLECLCYPYPDGLSVYFRDIGDRRRAQQKADDNERRVKAILEATPVGLAYVDASGRVEVINGEGKRIWGNPPQADTIEQYAEWKGWWADQSERRGQAIAAHDWPTARALRGEHVMDAVAEIEPFDAPGTRRTILLRSVPIRDAGGRITGVVTAQTDITEFERTKAAALESNHRIRQLANTIPQLAWMADRTGTVHWYNERWYDYTGQKEGEELHGWIWARLHDSALLPEVLAKWAHSLHSGTAFEMTFPLMGKDGQYRSFYTLAEPLKDLEGKVVQWFGTCTDVSKMQSIQHDLTKTQHWLQEGLVAGHMVAWEWDFGSDEVRYSGNGQAVLGHGPGQSASARRTIHPEDLDAFDAALGQAIAARASIDQLTRRIRPDNGMLTWIRVKGRVLDGENGQAWGVRGILIDVTDQVLREQALEEANKRKDEFLAMLAHELRNPLAPIATAAQMLSLAGNVDAARVKRCAEIIGRQLGHMTRLIDDLLDVSRVTRGLVELENKPLPVRDIVNNAIEQVRPLVEARRHELTVQFGAAPAMVLGDRVRLCQVVANLLNNSAKYTPQGGRILLSIATGADEVSITIADNGIGIDAKLLPHVFDLFTQATRTPDRAQGGLGLGLALVDSLVRMHGGRVDAHSEGQGHGASFVVALPLLKHAGAAGDAVSKDRLALPPEGGSRLSIMLVDDNVDAVEMLAEFLRLQGHAVSFAHTSTAALATADAAPYDLYILDIGLPDLDGYELVRRLRSMPHNASAAFIALTGYGQAHDKVLSKSAGFDHHLVKPVDFEHLSSLIRDVAPPARGLTRHTTQARNQARTQESFRPCPGRLRYTGGKM